MRKIEEIDKELQIKYEKLRPIEQECEDLKLEIAELEQERTIITLERSLFHPIEDLFQYREKEISYIQLVRNDDGVLSDELICNYGTLRVDTWGHLYGYSQIDGVIVYDTVANKYLLFNGKTEFVDYVGFLEIKFEEE